MGIYFCTLHTLQYWLGSLQWHNESVIAWLKSLAQFNTEKHKLFSINLNLFKCTSTSGNAQLFGVLVQTENISLNKGYLAHHGSLGPHSCCLNTLICTFTTKTDKKLMSMYCFSSLGKPRCLANRDTIKQYLVKIFTNTLHLICVTCQLYTKQYCKWSSCCKVEL